MFVLLFYLSNKRIRIRIREAQKHMDPTDPDQQHRPIFSLCLGGENVGSGDGKALHIHRGDSRLQRSLPLQTVRSALPGQRTA
jgi:hypothetical protein